VPVTVQGSRRKSRRAATLQPPAPMTSTDSEARKALNRLQRALEKSRRELRSLSAALDREQASDHPAEAYTEAESHVDALLSFARDEGTRLQERVLRGGGLEPGRLRSLRRS
jgi:hypothetical protein